MYAKEIYHGDNYFEIAVHFPYMWQGLLLFTIYLATTESTNFEKRQHGS